MKILLLGKNGQIGHELNKSISVIGQALAIGSSECDLTDEKKVRRLIRKFSPNIIINAAAYTSVDKAEEEPEVAMLINGQAPQILAEEAKNLDALLVHYSTDYVFDGTKEGSYTEDDSPNPINTYGKTKLAGDERIQLHWEKHFILRTTWVTGVHGNNFPKTILKLAQQHKTLRIVCDQIGVPTSADLLAQSTLSLLNRAIGSREDKLPYGIYNLVPNGLTNWYELACYILNKAHSYGVLMQATSKSIIPIVSSEYQTKAKRPLNSKLETSKWKQQLKIDLPEWKQGIDHILAELTGVNNGKH